MTDKPGYRRPQEGTQPEYLHPTYQSTNLRSPSKPLVFLPHSLSEITGPTIGAERVAEKDNDLTAQHDGEPLGERIIIHGRVLDENGLPVPGILVEIWQANAAGKYDHEADQQDKPVDPAFRGWGRTGTAFDTGVYTFETIKPGKVAGRAGRGEMAPHVNFWVAARGINIGLSTRMYFSDEEEANRKDPVLNIVEQAERRKTLIAQRSERDGKVVYTFDIRLQGEDETVFFDI